MRRVGCSSCSSILHLLLICMIETGSHIVEAQQTYVNNRQLDCDQNHTTALGYVCGINGSSSSSSSCSSYLTFRSQPPNYNTPSSIATLLNSDPNSVVLINNLSSTQSTIPTDTILIIPISNCSCSSPLSSQPQQPRYYYQHNTSFLYNNTADTYFSISNNTFQGLTTCQALTNHNSYNFRQLSLGINISIPLRCACPTPNQTAAGIRYLLTYLITWGDSISSISSTFGLSDLQSIYDANQLSPNNLIFPFTPLLVPLTTQPTRIDPSASPPPPPSPPLIPSAGNDNDSSRTWVFVGVGIGIAFLLILSLSGFLVWYFRFRRKTPPPPHLSADEKKQLPGSSDYAMPDSSNSWSVSAEGLRFAVESLTVYKYGELEAGTACFSEENRLQGQVYRGSFKGDYAAVKIIKGDVSGVEINILKHINHSSIIRLSGFCLHQGNTYLVYEYAENGSLTHWLTHKHTHLGWKERVQIANDIADALNYLHNFTNPPYIHKNLKSSNVLLDRHMRAKITNFGLARSVEENENENEGLQLQLTRHVVGTYGYMPPEYIENGLITPKLDVFALGVVMLELLSGKEAAAAPIKEEDKDKDTDTDTDTDRELQLSARIMEILGGENVRGKLGGFMDVNLKHEYPLDLAYTMAQLAGNCVANDLNARPSASEVLMTLSKILASSMEWDPSDELENSRSLSLGR